MLAKLTHDDRYVLVLESDDACALVRDYVAFLKQPGEYHPQAWDFIKRINFLHVQKHGVSLDESIDDYLEDE